MPSANWTAGLIQRRGEKVSWSCQWCKAGGDVDIDRIITEKGEEYSMMDRLPLCISDGCLGMIRFRVTQRAHGEFLMTHAGDARFMEHCDWVSTTRSKAHWREMQRLKRQRPATREE